MNLPLYVVINFNNNGLKIEKEKKSFTSFEYAFAKVLHDLKMNQNLIS